MADIKISELEPTTDLEGLYTIGSDKNNLSKKVSLQFLKDAANYANEQGDYAKQAGDTVNGNVGVSDYPEFSASKSYVIGDIVRYNGVLYAFTANHAASAWNGSDVKATSINAITSGKLTELESETLKLGFFDKDSDFRTYNNIRIYDIYANDVADTSIRLKLFGLGVLSNSVFVAICKDEGTYPSNCVARIVSPISNYSELRGIQKLNIPKYNGDIDFTMIVNIDDLKSIPNVDQSSLFLNSEYINRKAFAFNLDCIKDLIPRTIKGVKRLESFQEKDTILAIKEISANVPSAISNHEFYLYTLYWNSDYNRLYMRIYDKTDNVLDCYAWKQYSERPISGIENVVFTNYAGKKADGDYTYSVKIDWSLFSGGFDNKSNTGIFLNVNMPLSKNGLFEGENTPLEDVFADAKSLTGSFTLTSAITLSENQHIDGGGSIVYCDENAKIIMAKGAMLGNFKFIGNWNVNREIGDGVNTTKYGYVPLITEQHLSDGDTNAIFGNGKTRHDALITIADSDSYNTRIDGCSFENFDRLVIYAGAERHLTNNNPIISNNYFTDCRMGVYVGGEFIRLYANQYFRCVVAEMLQLGNSNQTNEIIKCCDCGIYFPLNCGAHNEITSVHICHCGIAGIYIKQLDSNLGCTFVGGHIADAAVIGESVSNMLFGHSRLDTYFRYANGQGNAFIANNMRNAYTYGNAVYDVPDDTLRVSNRAMGNTNHAQYND